MSVYTSGDWHVKPGREDEFVEAWQAFARATTAEVDSAMPAKLLRDREERSHFISFGEWKDVETIERWRGGDVFGANIESLRSMTESIEIRTLDVAATFEPAHLVR